MHWPNKHKENNSQEMGENYFSSKIAAAPSSKMSANFYQTTRLHLAEYDKFSWKKRIYPNTF
jgi:hypothetical protein